MIRGKVIIIAVSRIDCNQRCRWLEVRGIFSNDLASIWIYFNCWIQLQVPISTSNKHLLTGRCQPASALCQSVITFLWNMVMLFMIRSSFLGLNWEVSHPPASRSKLRYYINFPVQVAAHIINQVQQFGFQRYLDWPLSEVGRSLLRTWISRSRVITLWSTHI